MCPCTDGASSASRDIVNDESRLAVRVIKKVRFLKVISLVPFLLALADSKRLSASDDDNRCFVRLEMHSSVPYENCAYTFTLDSTAVGSHKTFRAEYVDYES